MILEKKDIRYLIRYINAYGKVIEKLVKKNVVTKWIKNWDFKYNGDNSGLEVHEFKFVPYLKELN
jgi:hypothetical protein